MPKQVQLSPAEAAQLRADLQDMHHYAALLTGLAWSTFEGCREFANLQGRIAAYERLYARLEHYKRHDIPALKPFCAANLTHPSDLESCSEIKGQAANAFFVIAQVAANYATDPNSGERIEKI